MARFFSNANVFSSYINKAINRRGFSAAAAPPAAPKGGVAESGAIIKKTLEQKTDKISWIPDPRTGFYRPENISKEIDAAELRAVLLKKHY